MGQNKPTYDLTKVLPYFPYLFLLVGVVIVVKATFGDKILFYVLITLLLSMITYNHQAIITDLNKITGGAMK